MSQVHPLLQPREPISAAQNVEEDTGWLVYPSLSDKSPLSPTVVALLVRFGSHRRRSMLLGPCVVCTFAFSSFGAETAFLEAILYAGERSEPYIEAQSALDSYESETCDAGKIRSLQNATYGHRDKIAKVFKNGEEFRKKSILRLMIIVGPRLENTAKLLRHAIRENSADTDLVLTARALARTIPERRCVCEFLIGGRSTIAAAAERRQVDLTSEPGQGMAADLVGRILVETGHTTSEIDWLLSVAEAADVPTDIRGFTLAVLGQLGADAVSAVARLERLAEKCRFEDIALRAAVSAIRVSPKPHDCLGRLITVGRLSDHRTRLRSIADGVQKNRLLQEQRIEMLVAGADDYAYLDKIIRKDLGVGRTRIRRRILGALLRLNLHSKYRAEIESLVDSNDQGISELAKRLRRRCVGEDRPEGEARAIRP